MTFVPYANEAETLRLDRMTVENRLDRVSLFGSLELTRDQDGLRRARRLHALLGAVVSALEQAGETLPPQVQTGAHTDTVRNPFSD